MKKDRQNINEIDALKGFLFRGYNARRCKNVGQALPDDKIDCHAETSLLSISTALTNQGRDSEQKRLRMTTPFKEEALNKNPFRAPLRSGFTLIELLVVVLIIGILAAIAVPQYQKAILKSRFSSLMPLAKTLSDSEEAYYLEHGTYTEDKTKLDVTTTDTNATVTLGNEEKHQYVKLTRSDIKNQLTIYQKHSPNFAGETHCEALLDNTLANWLCADSLKGTYIGDKFGYSIYSLSTETAGTLARNYYNTTRMNLTDGDSCTSSKDYGCEGGTFSKGASCVGNDPVSCRNTTASDHASCISNHGACYWSTFTDYSICEANVAQRSGCVGNTYKDHSGCYANARFTCTNGLGHNTYADYSFCVGNASNSCEGGTFSNYSYCRANQQNSCKNATYDETSYCEGIYCPAGSPKQDGTTWQLCEGEKAGGKTC